MHAINQKIDDYHTLWHSLIQIYQGNSPFGKHIFVQRGVPHSMLWMTVNSRYTACCWAQGEMEGRGKERVILLTRHKHCSKQKHLPPNRSAFDSNTWMRKGKINRVKSAREDSGRPPWKQKANKFRGVATIVFPNVRRWMLNLTFHVTQIIRSYLATMRLWPMHPYLPNPHLLTNWLQMY